MRLDKAGFTGRTVQEILQESPNISSHQRSRVKSSTLQQWLRSNAPTGHAYRVAVMPAVYSWSLFPALWRHVSQKFASGVLLDLPDEVADFLRGMGIEMAGFQHKVHLPITSSLVAQTAKTRADTQGFAVAPPSGVGLISELPSGAPEVALVPQEPALSPDEHIISLQSQLEEAYREIRNLSKKLRRRDNHALRMAGIMSDAVSDVVPEDFRVNAVDIADCAAVGGDEYTLVVCLSDLHIGASIDNQLDFYDYGEAKKYLDNYAARVVQYILLESKVRKITEVALCILGDCIEGDGIYPTQSYEVLEGAADQAKVAVQYIWEFIESIRTNFKRLPIRVYCVSGNHGRQSKEAHLNSNWDRAVYNTLEMMYNNPGPDVLVTFSLSTGLGLYECIGNVPCYLVHGKMRRLKSQFGLPHYGIYRLLGSLNTGFPRIFKDYMAAPMALLLFGHFHMPQHTVNGKIHAYGVPSILGVSDLVANEVYTPTMRGQLMLLINSTRREVSAAVDVTLEDHVQFARRQTSISDVVI